MMSGILQEICYSTGVSRDTGLWLTNRVMKENTQNVQNREPGITKSVDLQRKYDQLRANNLIHPIVSPPHHYWEIRKNYYPISFWEYNTVFITIQILSKLDCEKKNMRDYVMDVLVCRCGSISCENGGVAFSYDGSCICDCLRPYTGPRCADLIYDERSYRPCSGHQCKLQSTCVADRNDSKGIIATVYIWMNFSHNNKHAYWEFKA